MPRYVIEFHREHAPVDTWEASGNCVSPLMEQRLGRGERLYNLDFPDLETAIQEAMEQQRRSASGLIYRARDTRPELAQEGPMRDYWSEWTWRGDHMEEVAQGRAVRIYRRNSRWVVDSAGRELPHMAALCPYLPQSARVTGRNAYQVMDALTNGMNPQMLAGALSAYFTEHPNANGQIRIEEGRSDLPDNMAYLAFGDFVYRMVPVRQVSSGRAMKAMREKLAQEMRTLRTGLEQQAGVEARQIVATAQVAAARINAEVAAKQLELRTQVKFPPWVAGHPVMSSGETTWLCMETHLTINRLIHGSHVWPISPYISLFVDLWYPLDGMAEKIRMQTSRFGYLPHVNPFSACMKIGEKVKPIKSLDDLMLFQMQVARTLQAINLASLLETNWNNWRSEIQEKMPDALKPWLNATSGNRHAQQAVSALPPAPNQERAEETWTTR